MKGPPLGPGREDITWPDQVASLGRKASSTRKIKPQTSNLIHGKLSRQSVWGKTVPIIGAVTPMHPAPAIMITPPDGKSLNRVEAKKHISYALMIPPWPQCRIGLLRSSSLNLLPKPLPLMFYLLGVMGPCGSSLPMASHRIRPRVLTHNLEETPTWKPSIGSRVWLRLPVGFRRWMKSFPLPRTHHNCIECALRGIGFPIVSRKFGQRNYEPSS